MGHFLRSKKVHFRYRIEVPKSIDLEVRKEVHFGLFFIKIPMFFIGFVPLNWGPFWGPFLGTFISQPGSLPCIRVRLCFTFGTPHPLTIIPFWRSENWPILVPLKWTPKWSILGSRRSPFLGPFFGTVVRERGVPKMKQSRTRMQYGDPGLGMRVPKNGPQNGP